MDVLPDHGSQRPLLHRGVLGGQHIQEGHIQAGQTDREEGKRGEETEGVTLKGGRALDCAGGWYCVRCMLIVANTCGLLFILLCTVVWCRSWWLHQLLHQ